MYPESDTKEKILTDIPHGLKNKIFTGKPENQRPLANFRATLNQHKALHKALT